MGGAHKTATVTFSQTSIAINPLSQTVTDGQSATFEVSANGVAPSYQWRKGGVNITGATSPSYTILPVHSSDAANYDVVVTDACGNTITSSTATLNLNKTDTTTGLSSSANPSAWGAGVSFAATVTAVSPGTGTPTGMVQFKVNGSNLGTPVTLAGGRATIITTSTLALGDYNITAVYNGDTNYNTSTSGTLTQTVSKAPATVTLGNLFPTTYDGTPKTATSTTTPSGLTVHFTYNGSTTGRPMPAVTRSSGPSATATTRGALPIRW